MKDRQADAAAFWLFDQRKCRAEWARLKGPEGTSTGLARGIWYEIRSHDSTRKTVYLDAGDKEVEVHIDGLAFRADRPVKTIVFFEGQWGERLGEVRYVGNCPGGHEKVLGNRPPTPDEPIRCDECGTDYEWERERETATPSGSDTSAG